MVIGGAFQDQLGFARTLEGLSDAAVTDGASCPPEAIWEAKILDHFHLYVRRAMARGIELDTLASELSRRNPGICIVSDELGYGVVPVDPMDRAWREMTGRVCTALAAASAEVYRVVCGIGARLK